MSSFIRLALNQVSHFIDARLRDLSPEEMRGFLCGVHEDAARRIADLDARSREKRPHSLKEWPRLGSSGVHGQASEPAD